EATLALRIRGNFLMNFDFALEKLVSVGCSKFHSAAHSQYML
ncbi:12552_t:CDS:1, partial [Rhizophagus irregularis]